MLYEVITFLNDRPVYYSENQSILSVEFNTENPKAVITYNPDLPDGDYVLKVFGQNTLGNMVDSTGRITSYNVCYTKLLRF